MIKSAISINFGTDGWRAVIAKEFTTANLMLVAQAYADYIKDCKVKALTDSHVQISHLPVRQPLIIIGYDNRFLSETFAQKVAEVLTGNNIEVIVFSEAVPTPIISWGVREKNADGGIVITASHNSAEYNGFKIKSSDGASAPSSVTNEVEARVNFGLLPLVGEFSAKDSLKDAENIVTCYRRHISNYFDLEFLKSVHSKVILDSMHGCGGKRTESFLVNGAIEVETMRSQPDPLFGGNAPEPIEQNLKSLKRKVKDTGAVLGIATDGDADRFGAVNERGQMLTMHEVAPLLLLHLIKNRKLTGNVACTVSQSVLMKRIAVAYNLPFVETPIGFKYLAALMLEENILISAEESGGIGIQGHLPERDGIFNSLLLIEAVTTARQTISDTVQKIYQEFGQFYFGRQDMKIDVSRGQELIACLADSPPSKIDREDVIDIKTLDGVKLLFADESWILFRQSGTEPVLRIYAEATSKSKMKALLNAGCSMSSDLKIN